jgi:predicted dehydrogenase
MLTLGSQYGTCVQEQQSINGMSAAAPEFGIEEGRLHGLLTTLDRFDETQALEPKSGKYIGQYPTVTGQWRGFYENLAEAIQGKAKLAVAAEDSRDGLRIMELARESHETGRTISWL